MMEGASRPRFTKFVSAPPLRCHKLKAPLQEERLESWKTLLLQVRTVRKGNFLEEDSQLHRLCSLCDGGRWAGALCNFWLLSAVAVAVAVFAFLRPIGLSSSLPIPACCGEHEKVLPDVRKILHMDFSSLQEKAPGKKGRNKSTKIQFHGSSNAVGSLHLVVPKETLLQIKDKNSAV